MLPVHCNLELITYNHYRFGVSFRIGVSISKYDRNYIISECIFHVVIEKSRTCISLSYVYLGCRSYGNLISPIA